MACATFQTVLDSWYFESTMGLFYVWHKFQDQQSAVLQRVIAFVSREAADEWWRIISTPPSVYAAHVKRVSPQLYVQIYGEDVWSSFGMPKSSNASRFFERMFVPYTDRLVTSYLLSITPTNEVTDHISGRWYFIRSKADPSSHWYLRTSGTCAVCGDASCSAVHVSCDYRTRFCVRVRNVSEVPENFVMIGKDAISIAAPKGHVLHVNDAEDLKATKGYQGEIDLLFGDLKNRFVTRAERQVNGEVWEYVESVERGVGEPWELFGE